MKFLSEEEYNLQFLDHEIKEKALDRAWKNHDFGRNVLFIAHENYYCRSNQRGFLKT